MARRSRPRGPQRILVICLVAVLLVFPLSAVFVVMAVNKHAQAAQSSYVQAHGLRESATVGHVDNKQVDGNYTATVTVQLQPPVNGTTSSIVHVPHQDNSSPGDTITVLVDPSQPGYSELPGAPSVTGQDWIVPLVIAVVILLFYPAIPTWYGVRAFRQLRAARALAMRSSPA